MRRQVCDRHQRVEIQNRILLPKSCAVQVNAEDGKIRLRIHSQKMYASVGLMIFDKD